MKSGDYQFMTDKEVDLSKNKTAVALWLDHSAEETEKAAHYCWSGNVPGSVLYSRA
jgi:hypothetical protein